MGHIGLGEILLVVIVAICVLKPRQLLSISFLLGKLCGTATSHIKKLKKELNQTFEAPKE